MIVTKSHKQGVAPSKNVNRVFTANLTCTHTIFTTSNLGMVNEGIHQYVTLAELVSPRRLRNCTVEAGIKTLLRNWGILRNSCADCRKRAMLKPRFARCRQPITTRINQSYRETATTHSPLRCHQCGSLSNRICRVEVETTLYYPFHPAIEGVSAG